VLVYDWSEGGETEVVVEDIERLNLDYFDKYDKQQKDWRLHNEVSLPPDASYSNGTGLPNIRSVFSVVPNEE
jgi:hypothetical protein